MKIDLGKKNVIRMNKITKSKLQFNGENATREGQNTDLVICSLPLLIEENK